MMHEKMNDIIAENMIQSNDMCIVQTLDGLSMQTHEGQVFWRSGPHAALETRKVLVRVSCL